MSLEFAAVFLPFAGLVALVVMWLRLRTQLPNARRIVEAVVTVLGVIALMYGTFTVLHNSSN